MACDCIIIVNKVKASAIAWSIFVRSLAVYDFIKLQFVIAIREFSCTGNAVYWIIIEYS